MKYFKGFTLIELLVVIAIIALLLAIIMPSLRLAKDHAKRIACSADLRSLSMAALFYADENDALTPSSTTTWNDNGITRAGWVGVTSDSSRNALPGEIQVFGNGLDEYTGLHKAQLWPYIETIEAWRCPTDPDKEQLRSYCMAAQWWGLHARENDLVWYDLQTTGLVCRKISDIKGPGQRFFFVDAVGSNLDAYFALWYSQPVWWNIPQFNHGGGSVNGFADGHVEAYKMDADTVKRATEAAGDGTGIYAGYKMEPDNLPDSEDLKYYQRATWGKLGWQ
jgi:prepilin-type N-terminal cleavage/methylation domain-containing protein/prepilin-type processing-associated H-X9-DG protein